MSRCMLILILILVPGVTTAHQPLPSEEQVLEWLRELEPLPKVHYSWPLPFETMSDAMLFEYVRLTGAASLSGEWGKPEQMERAVAICQRVNAAQPKTPASIGINFSVWHRRFGKDLPPTDAGPTHQAELDYLKSRMEAMRDALAEANKKHESDIAITAILFDSERFHVKPGDAAWNAAITAKYDAATGIVRAIFPSVRIEWYARGGLHPSASATGWSESPYFTLDERAETFGCSLYQVPEIGYTREIFRRTAANAAKHGCHEVTPWIALASGYRRRPDKFHEFSYNWSYDLIYSWQLGAEVNDPWFGMAEREQRFAPWRKAKIAIFYPEPFGRSVRWPEHFVAYVRGAHQIRTLPELRSDANAVEDP